MKQHNSDKKTDKPRSSKTVLVKGEFLSLIREAHWEYAERVNASGAAIIVAVTDDQKIVLVEQYRIPCGARTIEMPAGISGDGPDAKGEALAETARRELLEETGYAAASMELLMTGAASSGLSSELVTLFLAKGLSREGPGGGHAGEGITVHEVPLCGAHEWLAEKAHASFLVDPKIYAGLYFISRQT
jgi:ADP-ribose pyrophosphatase